MKPLGTTKTEEELDGGQSERRTLPRVPFPSSVDVVYQGVIVNPPPLTTDISEGGLCLEGLGLPPERQIKIFITLPLRREGRRLLLLKGRIAWQNNTTVGVAFLNPPPESVVPLRQFVAERTEDPTLS